MSRTSRRSSNATRTTSCQDLPWVDGVEWMVVKDPSAALAMYRSGQFDCGPAPWWSVRQEDLESVKKTHPHLMYQDFLSTVSHAIYMRTDQAPFNDVRVRRAISHAIDRQAIIEAVWIKGEPTPAVSRGLAEWSPRIDELGAGAKYYQYDPKEARRLLAEAGVPKGFKTLLTSTTGYGRGPASMMPRSWPSATSKRSALRRVEDRGVRRLYGDDVRSASSRAWSWLPSALPGNRIAVLYRTVCARPATQQRPCQ